VLCFAAAGTSVHAVNLPAYSISNSDRTLPVEDVIKKINAERDKLGTKACLALLEDHDKNTKVRLGKREVAAAGEFHSLKVESAFWNYTLNLKQALLSLHANPDRETDNEADSMAKITIETLYNLSQKWKVGNSALFRNLLIRVGAKEKGYCYHYVSALMEALSKEKWHKFDLHWASRGTELFAKITA